MRGLAEVQGVVQLICGVLRIHRSSCVSTLLILTVTLRDIPFLLAVAIYP